MHSAQMTVLYNRRYCCVLCRVWSARWRCHFAAHMTAICRTARHGLMDSYYHKYGGIMCISSNVGCGTCDGKHNKKRKQMPAKVMADWISESIEDEISNGRRVCLCAWVLSLQIRYDTLLIWHEYGNEHNDCKEHRVFAEPRMKERALRTYTICTHV